VIAFLFLEGRERRFLVHCAHTPISYTTREGEGNPADAKSWMSLPTTASKQNVVNEYYRNFIAAHAAPKSMTLQETGQATQVDKQLKAVITALKTGQWHSRYSPLLPLALRASRLCRDQSAVTGHSHHNARSAALADTGHSSLKSPGYRKIKTAASFQSRVIRD